MYYLPVAPGSGIWKWHYRVLAKLVPRGELWTLPDASITRTRCPLGDHDFGPIGILQCYDGYFPEAWGCTSFNGAEIILWINGREGMVEDGYCRFAADAYGCVVGANITDGKNTGFAGRFVRAPGVPEEARLFPRIKEPGDGCVHATIDLAGLRRARKHLRTMHQRRPELYGRLTEDIKIWQDYPDIPWDSPECPELVNKAQLEPQPSDGSPATTRR